jgi:chemotaxis receptor (MCP) glutamine deamidase CheD
MGYGRNGNLIPLNERDPEEAFKIRSKGGEACATAQRRRKELKETLNELLALGNTQEDLCAKLIAGEFNPSVFAVIRDTIGEKPVDKVENTYKTYPKVVIEVEDGSSKD